MIQKILMLNVKINNKILKRFNRNNHFNSQIYQQKIIDINLVNKLAQYIYIILQICRIMALIANINIIKHIIIKI